MHLHILGICGTFMGGLAQIAQASGHRVSGCDANVYPPMSDQLKAAGVELVEGFGAEQLALTPDLWVIGNVVTRGNPLMEAIVEQGAAFQSGPQWLAEQVLRGRHVLAVSGTHGKTTTTAMLVAILADAGREPGFLIGGVPQDLGVSARLGNRERGAPFVIEADEYDTAYFDKRSKFLHYLARTAIINNLEFDHADIFPDLAAIETQFHHWIRTLPRSARLLANADEAAIERVLRRGCWSEVERFGSVGDWTISKSEPWLVGHRGENVGALELDLPGAHNRMNALAAIAAAYHVGVEPVEALKALSRFRGVKRRLELRGVVNGVSVIDDFAHHPTAIAATLAALRSRTPQARLLAILEPRSNTMKLGAVAAQLAPSLAAADRVFCYAGAGINWNVAGALASLGEIASVHNDIDAMVEAIVATARSGDQCVVMSNGGFGGVHTRLLAGLERSRVAAS
ncbi:MAG: UDP-N-acetylmuramate:L-alanyl-gamma-D-glutamyl-meso-diaminopimelate ligase [Burkholderiaceae bacterium]